jgi:hypothetical protein
MSVAQRVKLHTRQFSSCAGLPHSCAITPFGFKCLPSMVLKTSVGWPPCYSARRSSSCCFRSLNMATASSGKVILRRPRFVFGGLIRSPAFVSSRASLDAKHCTVELDVIPFQCERQARRTRRVGGGMHVKSLQTSTVRSVGQVAKIHNLVFQKRMKERRNGWAAAKELCCIGWRSDYPSFEYNPAWSGSMPAKGETLMPATPEARARTRAFARVIGPFLVIVPAIIAVRAPSTSMGGYLSAFFENAALVWSPAA